MASARYAVYGCQNDVCGSDAGVMPCAFSAARNRKNVNDITEKLMSCEAVTWWRHTSAYRRRRTASRRSRYLKAI